MVYVIDTETTGLYGYPQDRVLEIGIVEYDEGTRKISPVYSELIHYLDIEEFDRRYVGLKGEKGVWIYRNSDMSVQDTLNTKKDLDTVAGEVRKILDGKTVTSYNTGFDFDRFLYKRPWNLRPITVCEYDIMPMATEAVMRMVDDGVIADRQLSDRLRREFARTKYAEKWVRSIDAYTVLCPDDPMGMKGRQTHRAIDDAIMEAHILDSIRMASDQADSQ